MEDENAEVAMHAQRGVQLFQELLAFHSLAEMLQDTQVEKRREAVALLPFSPDPDRNILLHRAIQDADNVVCRNALFMVEKQGDREFIPDLIELITKSPSFHEMLLAIQVLGSSGSLNDNML